jgi:signal transduction histidine kinase
VLAARLTEHLDQLHEVIQEIRTAIFDLQAGPSETPHLRATLHDVINELTADSPLRTTVRMSGPLDVIPPDLAQHVVAVAREAVSNVVRHAAASEVVVTVSVDDAIVIDVSDNGRGMPEMTARSGLHNLNRRANESSGSCTITPGDHGGTRLVWSAPLP